MVGGVIDKADIDTEKGIKKINLSPLGKDSPGVGKYFTEGRGVWNKSKGANFGT